MTKRERQASDLAQAEASDWSVLMGQAQHGDREAYRRLLTEVVPYLRAIARRCGIAPSDLEDAVQDVLLTVHLIRHTYDPSRQFGPWLVTIARRRVVDRLRSRQRRTAVEVPLENRHETFAAAETNLHEQSEERSDVMKAVDSLPERQKRAIILLKLKEMSLKEAARESGVSATSLKIASHRGVKTLRKLLADRRNP